jgi:hypothetical protein
MTGMETPNVLACNINVEPLFMVLLAAKQSQQHSHMTDTYIEKEDKMLCEAWLHIGTDPICNAE